MAVENFVKLYKCMRQVNDIYPSIMKMNFILQKQHVVREQKAESQDVDKINKKLINIHILLHMLT